MPYGNKMPKKMGCSGGGPNMYKVGSKEKNTEGNFSDKAMMYMKKMPAMYGKPKMMEGDPVKIISNKTGKVYETRKDNKAVVATGQVASPNTGEIMEVSKDGKSYKKTGRFISKYATKSPNMYGKPKMYKNKK